MQFFGRHLAGMCVVVARRHFNAKSLSDVWLDNMFLFVPLLFSRFKLIWANGIPRNNKKTHDTWQLNMPRRWQAIKMLFVLNSHSGRKLFLRISDIIFVNFFFIIILFMILEVPWNLHNNFRESWDEEKQRMLTHPNCFNFLILRISFCFLNFQNAFKNDHFEQENRNCNDRERQSNIYSNYCLQRNMNTGIIIVCDCAWITLWPVDCLALGCACVIVIPICFFFVVMVQMVATKVANMENNPQLHETSYKLSHWHDIKTFCFFYCTFIVVCRKKKVKITAKQQQIIFVSLRVRYKLSSSERETYRLRLWMALDAPCAMCNFAASQPRSINNNNNKIASTLEYCVCTM